MNTQPFATQMTSAQNVQQNRQSRLEDHAAMKRPDWQPSYSRWRHGGWYVHGVVYPDGACGCVSRNYADRKWRIACDPRPFEEQPTFKNRDAAAQGERELALGLWAQEEASAETAGAIAAVAASVDGGSTEIDR